MDGRKEAPVAPVPDWFDIMARVTAEMSEAETVEMDWSSRTEEAEPLPGEDAVVVLDRGERVVTIRYTIPRLRAQFEAEVARRSAVRWDAAGAGSLG